MRRGLMRITGLCVVAQALGVLALYGDDRKVPEKPFGLSKRVPWTSSKIVGSPEPPRPYRLKRVFERLKFQSPVCIAQEPETNRMLVAEGPGKIQAFSMDRPDADKPELFLDIKRQFYAFSFHPRYKENGYVFVFSPTPAEGTPGTPMSRVSRYQTDARTPAEDPARLGAGHHRVARRAGTTAARRSSAPTATSTSAPATARAAPTSTTPGRGSTTCSRSSCGSTSIIPTRAANYSIPKDNPFVNYPGAQARDLGVRVPQPLADELRSRDRDGSGSATSGRTSGR